MITLINLLALVDAATISVQGILAIISFILIVSIGVWKIHSYKHWFMSSLIFISLAAITYFFGNDIFSETIVHKLSDWSLTFLLLGAVQLARGSKNN